MNNIIETRIVSSLISKLVAAGYELRGVRDEESFERVSNAREALDAIFAVEEAVLVARKEGGRHWVHLVPGNGEDVIVDHSDTEELGAIVRAAYVTHSTI